MPSSYLSQKNTADMNSDDNILKRQGEPSNQLSSLWSIQEMVQDSWMNQPYESNPG